MKSEYIAERSTASGSVAASKNPVSLVYIVKQVDKPAQQVLPEFPSDLSVLPFLESHFPGSTLKEWNNWQWQVKNSIINKTQLQDILGDTETFLTEFPSNHLPFRITPYFANLLKRLEKGHPLGRTMIPTVHELIVSANEETDPLHEDTCSPVPNIVHRYPDRVLFLVTGFCAAYCRYCTRSHMVAKDKVHASYASWKKAIRYISENSQIRDVLISGGDPLSMPDNRIEYLLSSLRKIPHVEIIRIGTKVPVVLPMRITKKLTAILKKYHPLFMSVHVTHPAEFSMEAKHAFNTLANAGIPLGSQTVLLKGINDDLAVFRELTHEALKVRIRPYYLYQCDPIPGSAHFRTSVKKGLEIIRGLRGFTSGYAIPHYVIDAPGGGGKIPLLPEYVEQFTESGVVLKNYEGNTFFYPEMP